MPRNMSFALTTQQVRERTKTETRRIGWADLKPGQLFNAVTKCQGMKKGERIEKLALCRCLENRPEPLDAITPVGVLLEGFPDLTPAEFVSMFCQNMRCRPGQQVNRIRFEYVDQEAKGSCLSN